MADQHPTHRAYCIDFKGLSIGKHSYEMPIDNAIFTPYEECEVFGGRGICRVELEKSETMLQLDIEITGEVQVECDRCLDPCWIEIEYSNPLVVKFTNDEQLAQEFDGEVMWTTSDQLDLSHYIYESIILSLPYQRVHQDESECNAEVTSYLAGVEEALCEHDEEQGEVDGTEEETETEELCGLPTEQLEKLMALKAKMKVND